MRAVGLSATEVGPDGFLPADPAKLAGTLAEHDLQAVGGFVPVVLHVPGHDPAPAGHRGLDGFVGAGAETPLLSAGSGAAGHGPRPRLREGGWGAPPGNPG